MYPLWSAVPDIFSIGNTLPSPARNFTLHFINASSAEWRPTLNHVNHNPVISLWGLRTVATPAHSAFSAASFRRPRKEIVRQGAVDAAIFTYALPTFLLYPLPSHFPANTVKTTVFSYAFVCVRARACARVCASMRVRMRVYACVCTYARRAPAVGTFSLLFHPNFWFTGGINICLPQPKFQPHLPPVPASMFIPHLMHDQQQFV